MPKYINAEKIELKYEFGIVSDEGVVCIPLRDVKKSIEATPAADVVEVVRCKDCRYWENGKDYETYCNHWDNMMADTKADDYCSYGKRKDGAE